MIKKNRFIPLLLIISILLTICQGIAVGAEEQAGDVTPRLLFKYTGDEPDDSAMTAITGGVSSAVEEDEHKNVLAMAEGSTFFIDLGQNLTSGKAVISWDFKADLFNETYLRIYSVSGKSTPNDSTKTFDTLIYRDSGAIQSFKGLADWNIDSVQAGKYEKDKWHHMDLWLDLDKKTMNYYVNGKHMVTVNIVERFDRFSSLSMAHVNKGIGADLRFDNLMVGYAPANGYETGWDFCQYMPVEVEAPVYPQFAIDEMGNAFFGQSIKINANIKNSHNSDKNLTLKFKVYTEAGILKYEKTEDMVLKALEEYNKEYNFAVDEYGFYYAYLDMTDKDSGEVFKAETRFSSLNSPEEGVFNEKMGLNNSFYSRGGARGPEFLEMMAKAGFKFTRDAVAWDWVETKPGQFILPNTPSRWLPVVQQNGQDTFFILGTKNFIYNNEAFPVSESEIGHFKDYVEYVMTLAKQYGIKHFEVWNEPNFMFNRGEITGADYVRLLKECYEIIKKHIPDAKVYACSVANKEAPAFVRACLEAGAGNYCDGITAHPYTAISRLEEGPYFKDMQDIADLMEEFGIGDKELVLSEFGWTSGPNYVSEAEQAQYAVRASALSFDIADKIIWYEGVSNITYNSVAEQHFGFVRGWTIADITYEPKPVFMAMSNWNALMSTAKSNGQVQILDEDGYVCKFKDADGSDIYVVWKIVGTDDVVLDIGASKAIMYDFYGNQTQLNTNGGKVQLSVSDYPLYLKGSFSKCEEVKDAELISVVEDNIVVTRNDSGKINLQGGKSTHRIEVVLPENITLVENKGFKGGKATIKLKTGANPGVAEEIKVIVKDNSGAVVYTKPITVEYKTALSYDFSVKYYQSGRWQGVLKLTNNNNNAAVSGSFTATEPSALAKYIGTKKLRTVGPKQTELFEFNIPLSLTNSNLTIGGKLSLSNGETIEISETTYFTSLMPVLKTPAIDGKIELGEYNTNAPVRIERADMVQELVADWWDGKSDASATMYINYDKDYFYLAAVAEDDILGDNDPEGRIWANDSIQFAFANSNKSGEKITEIGIGLVNGEPKIERYSFLGDKENIPFLDPIEKEGFNKDLELQIVREGTKTIYELKLPWEDAYATADDFTRKNIYFSTILNDNDGVERLGWLEFCPGIGGTKNASLFSKVAVEKK